MRSHAFEGDWADLKEVPGIAESWAHGGLVVTAGGELTGFHAGQLVTIGPDGRVKRVVPIGLTEGHGITLVEEDGQERLWLCDPGFLFEIRPGPGDDGIADMFGAGVTQVTREPRVVKVSLEGEILQELPIPPVPATDPDQPGAQSSAYRPCGTAVSEERFGGNGDVWVADGYGSSLVHRFDKDGHHVTALTGEEGAGRFSCPHSVYIDRRAGKDPELYVADRSKQRVQVYDLDGRFARSFGEGSLNSPSGFAQWGEHLVVAELYGRLAAFDFDDRLVGYLGEDTDCDAEAGWPTRPGWPNMIDGHGRATAPRPGSERFNSPHALAVDSKGNLYVSEWLIGGRYDKLTATGQD